MDPLVIGIITGAFGTAGWCKVKSFSGSTEHFLPLKDAMIRRRDMEERRITVEEVKISGKSVLMKFEGVGTPEEARKLTGSELLVDRSRAQKLADGEHYIGDLCKCSLYYQEERVGQVVGMIEGGAYFLLEVRKDDGKSLLVPYVGKFIGTVDVKNFRIELTEGFLLS